MSLPLHGLVWAFACFAVVWSGVVGAVLALGIGLGWSTHAPAHWRALVTRALAAPLVTIGLGALGLVLLSSEAARPALDAAALPVVAVAVLVVLVAPIVLWPRQLVPWSGRWLLLLLGGLVIGGAMLWGLAGVVFSDPGAIVVLSLPTAGLLAWGIYRVLRR